MGETAVCLVCGAEKPVEEMVFAADSYICDTKECLLGAFEMSTESHQLTLGRLEAING